MNIEHNTDGYESDEAACLSIKVVEVVEDIATEWCFGSGTESVLRDFVLDRFQRAGFRISPEDS